MSFMYQILQENDYYRMKYLISDIIISIYVLEKLILQTTNFYNEISSMINDGIYKNET